MSCYEYHKRENETRTLLEILQEAGIYQNAPCNGQGRCGKCVVRFLEKAPEAGAQEKRLLGAEKIEAGYRLACLCHPKESGQIDLLQDEEQIQAEVYWRGAENTFGTRTTDRAEEKSYGIAIDIGTTTIAGILAECHSGVILQSAAMINHQRIYGADVISRIQASNEGKKWEMQRCIRQDLKRIVAELLDKEKLGMEQIQSIAVAGNTTMCHLLRGFSCETLGVAPFIPVDISVMEGDAAAILGMKEMHAKTVIAPGISAFVGADITAGLAVNKKFEDGFWHLFLDIGTNGEMALGNENRIYTTSTSAGPALEGGNISCGMASVPGAISHVTIGKDGKAQLTVIGEKEPTGICGTGIVDLAYELWKHRIIDENGTLVEAYFEKGYPLTEQIFFTQRDLRELQMAKAAICAGIRVLMAKAGITMDEIRDCTLAGGFGTQMRIESAAGIGLFPKELDEKVFSAGNTVLEGLRQYLTGEIKKEDWMRLTERAVEVNLAKEPEFDKIYMHEMNFY